MTDRLLHPPGHRPVYTSAAQLRARRDDLPPDPALLRPDRRTVEVLAEIPAGDDPRRTEAVGYLLKLAGHPEPATRVFFDAVAARLDPADTTGRWRGRDEWLARTRPPDHRHIQEWLSMRVDRAIHWIGTEGGAPDPALNSLHLPLLDEVLALPAVDARALGRSLSRHTPWLSRIFERARPEALDGLWASFRGPTPLLEVWPTEGLSPRFLRAMRVDEPRRTLLLSDAERSVSNASMERVDSEWSREARRALAHHALLLGALGDRSEGWEILTRGLWKALDGRVRRQLLRAEAAPRDLRVRLLREEPLADGLRIYREHLALGGEDFAYALLRACDGGADYGRLTREALVAPARFAGLPAEKVAGVYAGQRPLDVASFFDELTGGLPLPESELARAHPDFVDALAGLDPGRSEWIEPIVRLPGLETRTLRRFIDSDSEAVQLQLLSDPRIASDRPLRERLRDGAGPAVREALLVTAEYWDFPELAEELHEERPGAFLSAMERQTDRTAEAVPRAWLRPALNADDPELRRRASVQILRCG